MPIITRSHLELKCKSDLGAKFQKFYKLRVKHTNVRSKVKSAVVLQKISTHINVMTTMEKSL